MQPVEHHRRGDPLAPHELTRADHRRQEDAERTLEWVKRTVADAPPLSAREIATIVRLLRTRTPDHELMRWRLRLYCGHVIETTTHIEQPEPGEPARCPQCGLEPASMVAFEPLTPVGHHDIG